MRLRRGHAWHHRSRTRPVLITTLIAIPLAIGVIVGVVVTTHQGKSGVALSAHGERIGHHWRWWHWRHRPPWQRWQRWQSPAGDPVSLRQSAAQAAASMNCALQVPAHPLTAQGLATPYVLRDGCTMSNTNLQAFVEADILDPRTGAITVYNPLVITQGTTPAAPPVQPAVAPGDVVGLMFGFNGASLALTGTDGSLQQGHCVNGLDGSLFSQVAYCNSPAFFAAANQDIRRGLLKIPALGTGSDGQACPTTRSFAVVDQDQSDNVVSTYLLTPDGRTAQDSAANAAALGGAAAVSNGSDNALVNKFMDPALGCTPYQFPDATAASGSSGSQITDELLAAASQAAPTALVPLNDPMTLVGGQPSVAKASLYRLGVDQPPVSGTQTADSPANYCQDMMQTGIARTAQDEKQFTAFASPVPATGSNLFTFLAARLSASFVNLGCGALLNAPNPVHLTLDGNGVATAASFSPLAIGTLPGGVAPSPSASASPAATPTATVSGTPTPTETPSATATPTPTPTPTATMSGAATPGSAARAPSAAVTPAPTAAAAASRAWANRIGRPHHI
jgi:hypothetical protein